LINFEVRGGALIRSEIRRGVTAAAAAATTTIPTNKMTKSE